MLDFKSIELMMKSGFGQKDGDDVQDKRIKHTKATRLKAVAEWRKTKSVKITASKAGVPESTLKNWINLDRIYNDKTNINKRQLEILGILKKVDNATAGDLCKKVKGTKQTILSDVRRLIYLGLAVNISVSPRLVVAQIV